MNQEANRTVPVEEKPSDRTVSVLALRTNAAYAVDFVEYPGNDRRWTRHFATEMHYQLGCFKISPAILVGAHGVITTYDERILLEQNSGSCIDTDFVTVPRPMKEGVLRAESAVSLTAGASFNFYHWMLDSLPKVIIAEACGFQGTYIIPAPNVNPNLRNTLELLGIPPERAVHMEYGFATVNELWLPTHFSAPLMEDIPEVHERFREAIKAAVRGTDVPEVQRLFINRPPGNARRAISNQEEILPLMESFGFYCCDMAQYTVKEQIALAMQASFMVGPHGAGLTHLLWMPPASTVVEIFSTDFAVHVFQPHCRIMRHKYFSLQFPPNPDGTLSIDCTALKKILSEELRG